MGQREDQGTHQVEFTAAACPSSVVRAFLNCALDMYGARMMNPTSCTPNQYAGTAQASMFKALNSIPPSSSFSSSDKSSKFEFLPTMASKVMYETAFVFASWAGADVRTPCSVIVRGIFLLSVRVIDSDRRPSMWFTSELKMTVKGGKPPKPTKVNIGPAFRKEGN